ncbi:MAG: PQQ-binding-like beta-propeller repeat protein [Candidatus Aminicenantes bacterium]|nr:PQQ-binding-like beta-propeller repeat protein [Candidatus Aminicenantes bacterium]
MIFPLIADEELSYQGEILDLAYLKGDLLYFSTRNGRVYCLDIKNRKVLWEFKTKQNLKSRISPGKESFYIIDSDNQLFCVSQEGDLIWKTQINGRVTSEIVEFEDHIYLGTAAGAFLAYDRSSGERKWRFKADQGIYSHPAAGPGLVLFGCDDQKIYGLDHKGKLRFTLDCEDKIRSYLLLDGKLLYFSTQDEYFHCFDVTKRKRKWRIKCGAQVKSPILHDEKRLYFVAWDSVLYCLNKQKGDILWWNIVPSRSAYSMEIVKDRLLVSSMSKVIRCFDIATGKIIGNYEADKEIRSNPVWYSPFLMVNTYDDREDKGKLIFLKKEVKVTLTPSLVSPSEVNQEIIMTATPTGFYLPEFEFTLTRVYKIGFMHYGFLYLRDEESNVVREKSKENTWNWFPEDIGYYIIGVTATDEKEKASAELFYKIEKEEIKISLKPDKPSPQFTGEEIKFIVSAVGFQNPTYEFSLIPVINFEYYWLPLYLRNEAERKVVQEKSNENTWQWIPEKAGTYVIDVLVEDEDDKETAVIYYSIQKKPEEEKPAKDSIEKKG